MATDPMVVAMCSDNNGADFMQVAIKSLFVNNRNEDIELHIVTDGFSPEVVAQIKQLGVFFGREITIHNIDFSEWRDRLPEADTALLKIPKATYFRFWLPEILHDKSRVLYLDTDVIVNQPIAELFCVDLADYAFGAVIEPAMTGHRHLEEIGIDKSSPYFNAGMLLMNLERFRRDDISGRCLNWIKDNAEVATFMDQDALNVICHGKILQMPVRFNVTTGFFNHDNYGLQVEKGEWDEAVRNPVIVHYTAFKPWIIYWTPTKIYKKRLWKRYKKMEPRTEIHSRPWRKAYDFEGFRYRLKRNRALGWIYRACPGLWGALVKPFK